MKFRPLGNTDIEVSLISLGTMTYGEQNTEPEAFTQLDYALEHGINLIDTAEMYPVPPQAATQGATEDIIGRWFHKHKIQRDKVVLATKVAGPGDWMSYLRGGPHLNAAHIHQALDQSLQRLRTDYIDLYQIHWPERETNFFGKLDYQHSEEEQLVSIEETFDVFQRLIIAGKIRHFGISNETPWGTMRYIHLAEKNGWPRPVSIQNPYNLLNRSFEIGLSECAYRENVGLLAYSPLAFGVLSGKYLGNRKPARARLSLFERFSRYSNPLGTEATSRYVALAQAHSLDAAQMALAFINQQGFVTSNIIGATTMKQLKANIDSVDVQLQPELIKQINEIHNSIPNPCP